jgi:hypothetical protein
MLQMLIKPPSIYDNLLLNPHTHTHTQKLLEELSPLGRVSVSYESTQTYLCSTDYTYRANVTFVSLVGPVALLSVSNR